MLTIFRPFVLLILLLGNLPIQIFGQDLFNQEALVSLKIYNEKEINTANIESSPAFMGDKIAFVYTDVKGKLFDKEIDEPYFNVGFAVVNADNTLTQRQAYNNRINSDLHEGPMAYDLKENKMLLTRSHRESRKVKGIEIDTFYLRILSADLNAAKPVVKPININVQNYSVCHPALSSDGKMLVFSSNKPGGNGKMDLYTAYYDGSAWTGIQNLGIGINGVYNEVFPTLLNDTLLLFASDRPDGVGGLDMYVSLLKNGYWQQPELLPAPLNSPQDDLGLIVRENMKSGYFTSNRPGGRGKDDIYRFQSNVPLFGKNQEEMATSEIHIMDKLTLDPVAKAAITLTPLDIDINNFTLSSYNIDMLSGRDPGDLVLKLSPKKGQTFPEFFSDKEGKASFQVKRTRKYLLNITADGFAPMKLIYDYQVFGSSSNVVLEPQDNDSTKETEALTNDLTLAPESSNKLDSLLASSKVGDVVVLDKIYYDYNSYRLKKGATDELDALIRTMTQNPNLKVRLESHTDSRGTASYNLQLSLDRANGVRNYLTEHGIDEDRINIRGYGESRLRNKCSDKVPCTESEHSYNRRTEVVIEEN